MSITLRDIYISTQDLFNSLVADNDTYGIRVLYTRTGAYYPLDASNPESVRLWELLHKMEVFVLSKSVSTSPGD